MKKIAALFLAGTFVLASMSASAQAPMRIRGTITGLNGNVLSVKSRDGKDLKIDLSDKTAVVAAKAITFADIKPGDFVGPASRKRADGSLEAISVQLFPAALRGVIPESHGPWDLEPGSLMTNSTVAKIAQAPNGRELTLEYPGGTQKVFVPEGVPMFTTVPGDRSLLVPGAYIFTVGRAAPDGSISTGRISVSKGGVRPAN
jgi:hypothetical protein